MGLKKLHHHPLVLPSTPSPPSEVAKVVPETNLDLHSFAAGATSSSLQSKAFENEQNIMKCRPPTDACRSPSLMVDDLGRRNWNVVDLDQRKASSPWIKAPTQSMESIAEMMLDLNESRREEEKEEEEKKAYARMEVGVVGTE